MLDRCQNATNMLVTGMLDARERERENATLVFERSLRNDLCQSIVLQITWKKVGRGSRSVLSEEEGGEGRVASVCSKCCLKHCSVLFISELQGQVCEQRVFTHLFSCTLHACIAETGICLKKPLNHRETSSHTPRHCTIPPSLSGVRRGTSGLWECHCAESTGGEQWLRCAACPFGRLDAAFQRGAPSAFGSVSLVDQVFACWSLTRCAHSACSSSGL